MELFLGRGADVNWSSGLPLSCAVRNGNLEAARLLLDRGADVNLAHDIRTPLKWARLLRFPTVVALLLEHGALDLPDAEEEEEE